MRPMDVVKCIDCGEMRWVQYRAKRSPKRCQKCNCRKMNTDRFPQDVQYAVKDPLYAVWCRMKSRCNNPNDENYIRYGGRGISVCIEWAENVYEFISWCRENGYEKGLQLDRINNDGPYSPGNCRFVTNQVNSQNTSRTLLSAGKVLQIKSLIAAGISIKEIAKRFGVNHRSISGIKTGKSWTNIGHNFTPKRFDYLSMISGC